MLSSRVNYFKIELQRLTYMTRLFDAGQMQITVETARAMQGLVGLQVLGDFSAAYSFRGKVAM